MGATQTIPVFDPNGDLRDIPQDQLASAVKAGGMPAVKFSDPSGETRFVPANRTHEAVQAGGKLVPFEQQEVKHPGFWQTVGEDLWGMGKSALQIPSIVSNPAAGLQMAGQMGVEDIERQQEGRSLPYRAIAPVGEVAGVNVRGMEESANEGDVAGVAGHAAAVPAVMATTHAVVKSAPAVADFSTRLAKNLDSFGSLTPKQVAQGAGAVTGAGLGHGTLSVPGAYYGAKGAGALTEGILGERANQPIIRPKNPGAPFPEAPPKEVLQASPLATAGQPITPEPSAALSTVRPSLPEAFQARPSPLEPPVGSATRPFKSIAEAPTAKVLQAVDELGPQATQQQILDKVNEPAKPAGDYFSPEAKAARDAQWKKMHPNEEMPEKMSQREIDAWQESAFGKKPEEIDVGKKVRAQNPEPTRSEVKAAAEKKLPLPEPPQIKAPPAKPSPADVAETEDIRNKVKNAAEAEDRARLREVYGERRVGSDVSTPKTVLTGVSPEGEGSDVHLMHPRGEAAPPDFTKLTKDIATPQQAMRQLENLKKAGANPNAINDFEMRASRAFGENWKHVASQHDDLTEILQKSLEAAKKQKPKNP